MTKNHLIIVTVLVSGILILVACSGAAPPTAVDSESIVVTDEHIEEDTNGGDEHAEEESHAHIDPPAEYSNLTNPFTEDIKAIEAGSVIYSVNCASCHGSEGKGDGPAAEALDPKPASLADTQMMADLSEGYLFWRVSEGGTFEPFNSVMPTWKGILSEDERWQVISFIRTLGEEH